MKRPFPILPKPPITEALIDLHVEPVLADTDTLEAVHDAVRHEFPERKSMVAFQVEVEADLARTSTPPPQVIGFQLWSADRKRVIQARRNGFAFSQLAPYDGWESLAGAARKAWDAYAQGTKPQSITRVAVRYINRINLPLPMPDFDLYLNTFPRISPELPQFINGLFMRMVLPRPEERAAVTVTEAFEEVRAATTSLPLILDIDVFAEEIQPTEGSAIWDRLNLLRDVKNDVFFNCLTTKALELFR